MKKLFILVVLFLLAILTAGSASAQNRIQANIPFDFMVVDRPLLAGDYLAEHRSQLLFLSGRFLWGAENAIAQTVGTGGGPGQYMEPKFVFRRYGEKYFLAQVWMGELVGREIPKSKTERQIARNAAEPEWIYIAAK